MGLEIWTLLVLLMVLGIKYGVFKHMGTLNRERKELEKLFRHNEQLYKALCQQREAGEVEEQNLKQDHTALEGRLKKLEQDLVAYNTKNTELQKLLG